MPPSFTRFYAAGNNLAGLSFVHDSQLCVGQLVCLVDNLMTLHKSEQGHLALSLQMIPLDSLIQESVSIVRSLADDKLVGIQSGVSEAIVWCDKDAAIQVFVNVLSNAIKFTPTHTLIQIKDHVLPESKLVQIAVEDKGPGVPDAMKTAIFERFRQAFPQRHVEKGGTGLGLTVCKSLLTAMNGTIRVTDGDGTGSIFTVTLPMASDEEVG